MGDLELQLIKAFFLGIVEGITEFIPVSSTGHLILIGRWINFESTESRVFEVVIQLGAILAVIWLFRQRIIELLLGSVKRDPVQLAFMRNLIIAFLPSAVIGGLFISQIKSLFFHPGVVVVTLFLGGLIMLWVERNRAQPLQPTATSLETISWKQALGVGFAQCLAMIPGTSRSGATIIGGMIAGIQRKTATEFSFFLAMPTMLAAALYDSYKHMAEITQTDALVIVVGFIAAFLSALLVVRAVMAFVSRHTYRAFGWYRILLSLVVAYFIF